jgi:1,4-dihydroxy-2-naphthoate octaprenyltransferase
MKRNPFLELSASLSVAIMTFMMGWSAAAFAELEEGTLDTLILALKLGFLPACIAALATKGRFNKYALENNGNDEVAEARVSAGGAIPKGRVKSGRAWFWGLFVGFSMVCLAVLIAVLLFIADIFMDPPVGG